MQQHRRDIRKVLWVHYFNTDTVKRGIKDQLLELDNRKDAASKASLLSLTIKGTHPDFQILWRMTISIAPSGRHLRQRERLSISYVNGQCAVKPPCFGSYNFNNRQRSRVQSRVCRMAGSKDKVVTSVNLQPIVPPSQAEAFQDLVQNPQDYTDLRPLKRNAQSPGNSSSNTLWELRGA